MELILIIRVLLRRWWLILLPVIVAAIFVVPDFLDDGSAVSGGFATQIKYSAAQEFNLPNRDGDYQDVWLASEFVVNAFTEWVRGNSFRRELETALAGEDIDLALMGISSDNERSVGVIVLSYPDDVGLQMISDAVMDVLRNRNQVYFPQLGGDPAQVTLLETPVIVPQAPPLTNRFAPLIRLAVALIGGVALAFAVEYFDQTFHYRDEVEAAGLPVLTSIPKR